MDLRKSVRYSLSARVSQFDVPPVNDGLVIGRESPIGFSAISKALNLLVADNFETVEMEDEVVGQIIVRRSILRRIPQDRLVAFIMDRVKPLMCAQEVLHLELNAEVAIEESDL